MNLKKKFVTAVSAVVFVASMMAPVGATQPIDTGSGEGMVVVADVGTFDVSICDVTGDRDFGSVGITTVAGDDSYSRLSICYVDTKMNRPAFLTMLYADQWTSVDIPAYLPQTAIPAANLSPTLIWSPVAQQLLPTSAGGGYIYGTNGAWLIPPVTVAADALGQPWRGGSLATAQQVGLGDRGRGTTFTSAEVGLRLFVPANTSPGTYTTTITVDVVPRVS